MDSGKIKWFNEMKGFGFIERPKDKDLFLHYSGIKEKTYIPQTGDHVKFETKQGKKGLEACNLVPAIDNNYSQPQKSNTKKVFPYTFVERTPRHGVAFVPHNKLPEDRFDIAFDVEWITETPTALTPCEDPKIAASAINENDFNTGYNKRWLQIDGKLAISPFTVKGAIANGVANILGGCYRVVDKIEGHKTNATAEGFPYTGIWKRYRVAMNKSYAGIIKEINPETGLVKIEKVTEYLFDEKQLPSKIQPGDACDGRTYTEKRKNFINNISCNSTGRYIYYGPYRFGMDLTLKPGDIGKKHYHRFYSPTNTYVEGIIPLLDFATADETKKKAYSGIFCKDDPSTLASTRNPRKDLLGKPWQQNLRELKHGDWCYYTTFTNYNGKEVVSGIGKNFQFKTFFNINDCLPKQQKFCDDLTALCPRCNLFGSTAEQGQKSIGYAGRFKAATLIADFPVTESKFGANIPPQNSTVKVEFSKWENGCGEEIVKQVLLPIMGPPKPSKRDSNGYFDQKSGLIKGAKSYHHGKLNFDSELPNLVPTGDKGYAYRLCGVAPVCKDGITFTGTLGGESCSPQEIAALLLLLDKRLAGNVFKLGLGKHLGLGSVSSKIAKIWLRQAGSYTWQQVEIPVEADGKNILTILKETLPQTVKQVNQLPKKLLNTWDNAATTLSYPAAGFKYWQEAKVETRK